MVSFSRQLQPAGKVGSRKRKQGVRFPSVRETQKAPVLGEAVSSEGWMGLERGSGLPGFACRSGPGLPPPRNPSRAADLTAALLSLRCHAGPGPPCSPPLGWVWLALGSSWGCFGSRLTWLGNLARPLVGRVTGGVGSPLVRLRVLRWEKELESLPAGS